MVDGYDGVPELNLNEYFYDNDDSDYNYGKPDYLSEVEPSLCVVVVTMKVSIKIM